MKKHKTIQCIDIKISCSQNWEGMNPQGQNRHCQSCNTTVYDFSKYTDEEVLAFFENKMTKRICGKFDKNRLESLNRNLSVPQSNTFSKVLKPVMMAGAISSLVACSSSKNTTTSHSSTHPRGVEIVKNLHNPDSLTMVLIVGKIVDDLGEPLIGASIIVDGLTIGTASDIYGTFQLKIPKQKPEHDRVLIQYTGYGEIPLSLNKHKNKEVKVTLDATYDFIGEMIIKKAPLHKRLWWKIKRIFS